MTLRSESLSAGEVRFDLWRRRTGLILGPAAALSIYLLLAGLPVDQRRLGAVLVLAVVFWITEVIPIPATALLGPALCVLLGVGAARDVFRTFADPIIFVFLGSFLIARGMTVHGLDRRVALAILRSRAIGDSPERIRLALGATAVVLSMWISNTATTAILFPIAVGISDALDRVFGRGGAELHRAGQKYSTGLMLMTAYAASIGGLATPVGTPPNLIGLAMIEDLAGLRIPFFEWMLVGVPVTLAMFALLCAVIHFLHPPPGRRLEGLESAVSQLKDGLPQWGRAQVVALAAFLTAVVLWMLPGFAAIILGTKNTVYGLLNTRLHEGVVALLAGSLLFLIPVTWQPLRGALEWRDAVEIDWGTILLFGGGLSLGGLMHSTGLAERLAKGLLGVDGATGPWMITAVAMIFAILVTETASNTASASMILPVVIAVSKAAGVTPIPAAIGATLAASMAFVLPVSTPPNAIMYGSGRITIIQMLRAGAILDFLGFFVVIALLRGLCPLLGLL